MSRYLWIVIPSLFCSSVAQAAGPCLSTKLSQVETTICSNPDLKQLDQTLNNTYGLARRAVHDQQALKTTEQQWLRQVRDRCESEYCLSSAYRERISELAELLVTSVEILEKPLSNQEAEDSCTSLAALAARNHLGMLMVPGREQSLLQERDIKAGWGVAPEELKKLNARKSLWMNNVPTVVYKLRLTSKSSPVQFGSFFTGCSSSTQILSIPYLSNSNGDDIGVEDVDDPDEEIRWAYWAGMDYPIIYNNRNYIVTSDWNNPNLPRMISWIKPDGKIRPLCLLSAQKTSMTVISEKDHAVCSGIASGDIRPLAWEDITARLPFSHDTSTYRDEFTQRYNDYADKVELLKIDLEGNGTSKNIGRFEYDSSAGCGSVHVWLTVLSKDLGTVEEDMLNNLLASLSSDYVDVYTFRNQYYISTSQKGKGADVFQLINGKAEKVCELGEKTTTSISKLFDVAP